MVVATLFVASQIFFLAPAFSSRLPRFFQLEITCVIPEIFTKCLKLRFQSQLSALYQSGVQQWAGCRLVFCWCYLDAGGPCGFAHLCCHFIERLLGGQGPARQLVATLMAGEAEPLVTEVSGIRIKFDVGSNCNR